MNRYIRKMLLRSIRATLGRYLAILSIVALGVGFFAGLKSSMPAMVSTADTYLRAQHMYDFDLMSTLGFTEQDETDLAAFPGTAGAEGAYFADALADTPSGSGAWHFMSLTERVNIPVLTEGRMPASAEECLGDAAAFSAGDLGKQVTLLADNDPDTLELFAARSYTLVGLARSPRYISGDRGSTSLGSGSLEGFVLLPREGFSSEAYHEMLLWFDLPGAIYSEEYNAARDRLTGDVKAYLNRLGRRRHAELWAEGEKELDKAQKEIDDGWQELADGREEAETELADARAELAAARRKLDSGWAEVNANQKALDEAMAAIPDARKEIAAGRKEIKKGRKEVAAGRKQIEEGRAQLEKGRAQLQESEQQVSSFRQLYTQAAAELKARESELRELLSQMDTAKVTALAPYYEQELKLQGEVYLLQTQIRTAEQQGDDEKVTELKKELAAKKEELSEAQASREKAEADYDPDTSQSVEVESIISKLHDYVDQLGEQLQQAEDELAEGKRQLAAKEKELKQAENKLDKAEKKLDKNEKKLDEAEKQLDDLERDYPKNKKALDDARNRLRRGEADLVRGWEEYYKAEQEAEDELSRGEQDLRDAEKELSDARDELRETLRLEVYTLDRSANAGYATFKNDTGIVDAIANAFPVFFALIAALVCVTTMTRMVNEERTLIGTMKAMGYARGAIMSKYLVYAGSSALVGCVAGFFLGTTVIPRVIWVAYSIMYTYDSLSYYFSPVMYALCLAVAVPGALLVTWLACRKELAGRPAELIRPKAPGKGKRILLEYITPLWRRMSFLSKVTVRNAFRYKQRVAMMLLGIGGCTALMVAGFGINDSVADISRHQYEEIALYDMNVTLDTEDFASDDRAALYWRDETERYAMTWQEAVTASAPAGSKSTRIVAARGEDLEGVIVFRDENGPLAYPGPGEAMITGKIADRLSLSPGDRMTLELDSGERIETTVSGVCKNFLGHYIYVCPETVGSPRNNTALLCVGEDTDPAALAARLRDEKGVSYVSESARERETMEQSMASLDLIVVMLIVCSGVLAFITLYNLTNINIMERTREIATVKVLGFYPSETASYILRENLMLSFLGAALGMGLGKLLHRFVMELVDVEYLTCDIRILPASYLWSFAITLVFAALTNLVLRSKLERVDMAESLKSVE